MIASPFSKTIVPVAQYSRAMGTADHSEHIREVAIAVRCLGLSKKEVWEKLVCKVRSMDRRSRTFLPN